MVLTVLISAAYAAIPLSLLYLWFAQLICVGTFILASACLLIIFLGIPIIFRYSYGLQRGLLFLNFVRIPNVDYNKPESLGLVGARSVRVKSAGDASLGVWHMLPERLQLEAIARNWLSGRTQTDEYDRWMRTGVTVVYCHGNAGTRASDHRVMLYKLLNKIGYHVIAFDYRGYADSSGSASDEQSVVEDTKAVLAWVKERVSAGHIFMWGHSLGTAIVSHTLSELESQRGGTKVTGVILEAPFNNLSEEIREYPISQLFRPLPWFDFFFVAPVYENGLRFESDMNLRNVTAPILFLHARDDRVVPYQLGWKLYQSVLANRKNNNTVEFVTFESKLGHGHKFIYRDKRISSIVTKFVEHWVK